MIMGGWRSVVGVRRLRVRVLKPILLKGVLLGAFSTVAWAAGVEDGERERRGAGAGRA